MIQNYAEHNSAENVSSPTYIDMYITDWSKAVLLIWFSVFSCSRVSFCAVLPSVNI